MQAKVFSTREHPECPTLERCYIRELSNSPDDTGVSIARARVKPGVTTALHKLRDTDERYLIIDGTGVVDVGRLRIEVSPDDVVWIPRGTTQRITNTGTTDLIFLCICSPRFDPTCYESVEDVS